MSIFLNKPNLMEYYQIWIQILANLLKLDITLDNFDYCKHEDICCTYYNNFFSQIKHQFNEVYIANEKFMKDENFLCVITCIFKKTPLWKIVNPNFLFKVFEYTFQNFDKSPMYTKVSNYFYSKKNIYNFNT